jgi:hypothetical protein
MNIGWDRFLHQQTVHATDIDVQVMVCLVRITQLHCASYPILPGATPAGRQTMKNWTTGPASEWDGPDDDDVLIKRACRQEVPNQAFGGKALC